MANRLAMLRLPDVEPLRSILPMMAIAGYDCVLPDRKLRNYLRDLGCRNVDEPDNVCDRFGAELMPPEIPEMGMEALDKCDLWMDVNGCFNGPKLQERHPRIKGKVLAYMINGGEPRNVPDKGDCQTPAVPMITTARHYTSTLFCPIKHWNVEAFSCDDPPNPRGYWTNRELSHPKPLPSESGEVTEWMCPHGCGGASKTPMIRAPWLGKVYVFWPAFTRPDRILPRHDGKGGYDAPVSFVHNCMSWGCQGYVEPARKLGVQAYGGGNSPDGMIKHEDVFGILQKALCTVYLKGGGAVDYSILEPMACGCPVTVHESYIHNTRLYDLLIPGKTCLTFSSEEDIARNLQTLSDPEANRRIGNVGRTRMQELCWSRERADDVESWLEWIGKTFK